MSIKHIISRDESLCDMLDQVSKLRTQILSRIGKDKFLTSLPYLEDILFTKSLRDNTRSIIGIGGCPASGKTTLAGHLAKKVNTSGSNFAVAVPMDGFHFGNDELNQKGSLHFKGAIDTYDADRISTFLDKYKNSSEDIFGPDYIREKHQVDQNAIKISTSVRLMIFEGIYIGLKLGGFKRVTEKLSLKLYLDSSPDDCIERIIARNVANGRSDNEIKYKIKNDLTFMKDSISIIQHADYIIRLPSKGSVEGRA